MRTSTFRQDKAKRLFRSLCAPSSDSAQRQIQNREVATAKELVIGKVSFEPRYLKLHKAARLLDQQKSHMRFYLMWLRCPTSLSLSSLRSTTRLKLVALSRYQFTTNFSACCQTGASRRNEARCNRSGSVSKRPAPNATVVSGSSG